VELRRGSRRTKQRACSQDAQCRFCSLAIAFVATVAGLAMSLLLAVALVPEPDQSRMHSTAVARPDTNPPPDPQLNEKVVKVPVTR
jgi:hypothetical protein